MDNVLVSPDGLYDAATRFYANSHEGQLLPVAEAIYRQLPAALPKTAS